MSKTMPKPFHTSSPRKVSRKKITKAGVECPSGEEAEHPVKVEQG